MERQVQHLVRLIDDLLDVSRITPGQDPAPQGTDGPRGPGQRARGDVPARSSTSAAPSADVSMPPGPVWLEADPVRLEQVLANLLNNAAKYTPPGATSGSAGIATGTEVVLSVRDDGIGIAPELLPHIFDLFIQADSSLARRRGVWGSA